MSTEFDTEAVKDQLDDLHDTLDELEEALVPLKLKDKDSTLDSYGEREGLDSIGKAKILVTIGYAIDSLLFSYLKTTGVSTEKHTIMNELERIKQYVDKIKEATAHQKRALTLNKSAANRVIGHDLSGNAAHDRDRALKTAQTNQRLQERLAHMANSTVGMHTRFENSGISRDATEQVTVGEGDQGDLLTVQDGDLKDTEPDSVMQDGLEEEIDSEAQNAKERRAAQRRQKAHAENPGAMFEETKSEKKARERRERKSAKKIRQKQTKAKQAAKAVETIQ